VRTIFFNEKGQFRSGWRAASFGSAYFVLALVLTGVAVTISKRNWADDSPATVALTSFALLVPAILVGLLCGKVFEGIGVADFGLKVGRNGLTSFAAGFGVGIVSLMAAVLPALAAGRLNFQLAAVDPVSLVSSLGVFAVAAAWEEALFRGYILQTLAREGYAWLAIVLTAAVFGLGHAGNPGSTAISTLTTVFAGIWFAVAYLRTKDLWFVWAMHLGWNWMLGAVLGIEVSGRTDISGLTVFREIDSGPDWLTGGTYGIEGSIAAVAAIVLSTGAIYFFPRREEAASGDLDLETNIHGPGRVSDPADRN
jgi:hypothetical protein